MKPEDLLFCTSHEWTHVSEQDGAKIATIGISAFAVEQLTDLVFLDLPEVGRAIAAGDEFGEVESVKAVSSLYCPVSGEVIEINSALPDALETLNDDPYGAGWMVKIKISDETGLSNLLDYQTYQKQCAEEE